MMWNIFTFRFFATIGDYTPLKHGFTCLIRSDSFATIGDYTPLKLADLFGHTAYSFATIGDYTPLKLSEVSGGERWCFATIGDYTPLKPQIKRDLKRTRNYKPAVIFHPMETTTLKNAKIWINNHHPFVA